MKDMFVSIDKKCGWLHKPIHINLNDHRKGDSYVVSVEGNDEDTNDVVVTILIP